MTRSCDICGAPSANGKFLALGAGDIEKSNLRMNEFFFAAAIDIVNALYLIGFQITDSLLFNASDMKATEISVHIAGQL